jgi:hypothetical protein
MVAKHYQERSPDATWARGYGAGRGHLATSYETRYLTAASRLGEKSYLAPDVRSPGLPSSPAGIQASISGRDEDRDDEQRGPET